MATKTYVRTGRIDWVMADDQRDMYEQVTAEEIGESFQADLDAPTEEWLIEQCVIAPAPDVAVTMPVDGTSAGDMPTADGSGGYDWEQ